MEYDQEFFEMFDLSPQAFPWTDIRRDTIIRRREEEMGGDMFFDELLRLAGIDAHAVYPPRDVPTFHHLVNSILNTSWDDFQQSCLIYYLLRHWEDGREKPFAQSKQLPPQFMFVSDAYYLLDVDRAEEAVPYLCDNRVLHEFTSKIMTTLSCIPDPLTASRCLLRFVRVAKPTLANQEDLDLYVNALCYSSITDAWLYQRSLPEGAERERHIHRIIMFCFHPKPRPEPLKTMLGFPFTIYEDRIVKRMAMAPPDILSDTGVAIFQNMIHVRLIHSGHYSEAIQLDRQFANAGTATGPAVKEAAARRKETLDELMGVIPVVQRRVLEMEIEEQEAEARKGKGPLIHGYTNGQPNGDLSMSWEQVNGSSSMMVDPKSPPRNPSAQPSSSSMTPLTASAAFRQAGSNAAVLKAFVHNSRLEGSPYLSTRSGSSTPIAAINFNATNSSVLSPFARAMSGQRAGSQATGSPAPSRLPRASFGSYPVRSGSSAPGSTLALPAAGPASKSTTRPAFSVPNTANKTPAARSHAPPTSTNTTPKPFINPLSSATTNGSAQSERRVTPVKRPFASSGGPGDRSMLSVSSTFDDSMRSNWSSIPAPEQADAEMDYDDGLDEDFVIQPASSRPRYNPPGDVTEPEEEQEQERGDEQEQQQEQESEQEPEPEPTPEPVPARSSRTSTRRNKETPAFVSKPSDTQLPGAFPSSPRVTRTSLHPVDEQESPQKPTSRRTTRGRVSRASSVAVTEDGEDDPKPRRSSRLSHVSESSPPPSPPRPTKPLARKSKSGTTKSTSGSRAKTRRQREAIPEEA